MWLLLSATKLKRSSLPKSSLRPDPSILTFARSNICLTFKWPRSRNGVAGRLRPVQLEFDTWVAAFVCTWEAHVAGIEARSRGQMSSGCRDSEAAISLRGARADIDLRTFHVELSSRVISCTMQGDELGSQQVSDKMVRQRI